MSDIERLFQILKVSERKEERLGYIHDLLDNTEYKESRNIQPSHLIAHGEYDYQGVGSEIRTAINVRLGMQKEDDMTEFSTNIGDIPNSPLSSVLLESLNHRLDGKFIPFSREQEERIDVVYTSSKPADWINDITIRQELEHHARTQALVHPIMEEAARIHIPEVPITFPEIRHMAQNIVSTKFPDPTQITPAISHSVFSLRHNLLENGD